MIFSSSQEQLVGARQSKTLGRNWYEFKIVFKSSGANIFLTKFCWVLLHSTVTNQARSRGRGRGGGGGLEPPRIFGSYKTVCQEINN